MQLGSQSTIQEKAKTKRKRKVGQTIEGMGGQDVTGRGYGAGQSGYSY